MSEQGLTERDYAILEASFEAHELGKKNEHTYVKRSAIERRLRLVDLNWKNDVDTIVQVIGDTVTVWGSLTLKGVTRRNSASRNVNAWASKANGGARIGESDYARELANAQMKATTALIFRCAEAFGVGLYLKEKTSAPSLASVLNDTPPHWALNGGGKRIDTKMKALGLKWEDVSKVIEADKVLVRLSETALTEEQVSNRLDEIALELKKKAQPPNGDSL